MQYLTVDVRLSQCIRYHRVGLTKNNLASVMLQLKKIIKNRFLNVLGNPPCRCCWPLRIRIWIFQHNFKSNQNWLFPIQELSTKINSQKMVNYALTEIILIFIWFLWWWQISAHITALMHKQIWKQGDAKINLVSFIPLQMKKIQNFWILECFLY